MADRGLPVTIILTRARVRAETGTCATLPEERRILTRARVRAETQAKPVTAHIVLF